MSDAALDIKNNPPESLKRRGILRAVDNIGPDKQLQVPASIIWAYFGSELRAHYLRPGVRATQEVSNDDRDHATDE